MGLLGFGKKSAAKPPPVPPGNPFDAIAYEENSPLTYAVRFAEKAGRDSTGPYELASVAKAFLEQGDIDRALKTILQITTPRDGLIIHYVGELFRLWIAKFPEHEERINATAKLIVTEAVNPTPKWRTKPAPWAHDHFFIGLACEWAEQQRWSAAQKNVALIAFDNLRSLALSHIANTSLKSQGVAAALNWFNQAKTVEYAGEFLEELANHELSSENIDAVDRRLSSCAPVQARFLATLARRAFRRGLSDEAGRLWDRAVPIAESGHPQSWEMVKPLTDLLCLTRPLERTHREETLIVRLLGSCRAANDVSEAKGGGPGWLSADAFVELTLNGREDLAERIAGSLVSVSNYKSVVAPDAWEEMLKASWLEVHANTAPLMKIERVVEQLRGHEYEVPYCAALARRYERENLPGKAASWWARLRGLLNGDKPLNRGDIARDLARHYLEADSPEGVMELLAAYAPVSYEILTRYLIEADLAARLFKHGQIERARQILDEIRSQFPTLKPAQNRSIAVQKVLLVLGAAGYWEEALQIFDEVLAHESDAEFQPCANRIGKELCLLLASQPDSWTGAIASRIDLLSIKLKGTGE